MLHHPWPVSFSPATAKYHSNQFQLNATRATNASVCENLRELEARNSTSGSDTMADEYWEHLCKLKIRYAPNRSHGLLCKNCACSSARLARVARCAAKVLAKVPKVILAPPYWDEVPTLAQLAMDMAPYLLGPCRHC